MEDVTALTIKVEKLDEKIPLKQDVLDNFNGINSIKRTLIDIYKSLKENTNCLDNHQDNLSKHAKDITKLKTEIDTNNQQSTLIGYIEKLKTEIDNRKTQLDTEARDTSLYSWYLDSEIKKINREQHKMG